jgi:adenine deaminase
MTLQLSGNIVDVLHSQIFSGTIEVSHGIITKIRKHRGGYGTYIMPGFVDAHVHIESSMLVPAQFARIAVTHGTVATVSDPHEIGNVLGVDGVNYMIENGNITPFKFFFGAPSCVPATPFETAGGRIDAPQVEALLKRKEVKFLSEVMNFPGVLSGDADLMDKIAAARKLGKRIDGHAPGLRGADLKRYIDAGISTDHESLTLDEALEKIGWGMKILLREGSAARNFSALASLIQSHSQDCMFCTDDLHPDDLVRGHINGLVRRAMALGMDVMKVLQCACVNPVIHYGLEVGLLREGDPADFIVVNNLRDFGVLQTFIDGQRVAEGDSTLLAATETRVVNNFTAKPKETADFRIAPAGRRISVIDAIDGQLTTDRIRVIPKVVDNCVVQDPERDILKLAVVNRYMDAPPACAFIRGFHLRTGAIASSVAHDSHNIIAVGTDDVSVCRAVNLIVEQKGGLCVVDGTKEEVLPLPVAGIMSNAEGFQVAQAYSRLDGLAKTLGCTLHAPFMTLSFMALLVIPALKLSDRGLFDVERFQFISLFD